MTVAFPTPPADEAAALRAAMRHMAGGVSVITAGRGPERTGLTVTTATSLSVEPPTMLVSINRAASAWPVITRERHFAVNILSGDQAAVADRFAGRGGLKGAGRYIGADWFTLPSGPSGLVGALAVIECAVDEIIERHTHAIVLGRVLSIVEDPTAPAPLVHHEGRFHPL